MSEGVVRHASHASLMEHLNGEAHGALTEHGRVTQDVTQDLKVEHPFKLEQGLHTLDVSVVSISDKEDEHVPGNERVEVLRLY